jgi:hypothetical protein
MNLANNGASGPSSGGKASGKAMRAARRAEVARLLRKRLTKTEIAKRLGCSRDTVHADSKLVLKDWKEAHIRDIGAVLTTELAVLFSDERLIRKEFEKELDPVRRATIYDRVLKIMERRAKLLGLDKPTQIAALIQGQVETHTTVEIVDHASLRSLSPDARREAVCAAAAALQGVITRETPRADLN